MFRTAVALLLALLSLVACSSADSKQAVPSSASPASTTSSPAVSADNREVQDTGCDVGAQTIKEITGTAGDYTARMELRISGSSTPPECTGLVWVRMTPVKVKDKQFAAVLKAGEQTDAQLSEVARQDARPSDPTVELITKGRTLKPGQQAQACLVRLDGQGLICSAPLTMPS